MIVKRVHSAKILLFSFLVKIGFLESPHGIKLSLSHLNSFLDVVEDPGDDKIGNVVFDYDHFIISYSAVPNPHVLAPEENKK